MYLFMFAVFVSGLLFCATYTTTTTTTRGAEEAYENQEWHNDQAVRNLRDLQSLCPDLLIKQDGVYKLYFSTAAYVPDVNPVVFETLDDYQDYIQAQADAGRTCPPPLFSQQEDDVQGKQVFRFYPSPFSVEGGLPPLPLAVADPAVPVPYLDAAADHPPFNDYGYTGFDPHDLYEGRRTALDDRHEETQNDRHSPSVNAMDTNWGGADFTNMAIRHGAFDDDQVIMRPLYPNFSPK